MTKTFKTCAIFCITTVWLILMRVIVGEINMSDNVAEWVFSFCVQIVGMGLIPLLLYKFWVKDSIKSGFAINFKINPLIWLLAVGVGITLHFLIRSVSVLWQSIAILMGYTPSNSAGTIYSSPEVLVMGIITSAVLPGICEELTYRGLGRQMFATVKDEKVVIIMMGLLFGLGHQFILQTGYAFVAGVVFAYIAIKTRSIIPGMIIHFINNCWATVSEYSQQKNNAFYVAEEAVNGVLFRSYGSVILTLAISAVATIGLLYLIKKAAGGDKKPTETVDGTTFFYPNTMQYIDDLFGKPVKTEIKVVPETAAWYEYAFLYASMAIMLITTIFTFVWGVIR